jgi:hypothetical protein
MKIERLKCGRIIKTPKGHVDVDGRHYQVVEDIAKARNITCYQAFLLVDKIFFPEGCSCDSILECERCDMSKTYRIML